MAVRPAMVGHVLVPGAPLLRKRRDINAHASNVPDDLLWGDEMLDLGHEPRMVGQPGDAWVQVGIGEDAV